MNDIYPAIVAAVFGSCLGSFTTMLVWRLHYDEKGICSGRSRCPKCKKTLSPLSLIPIFSWIFQRGKCLNCGKKISVFYPLVEITFAIVFSLFTYKFFRGNLIDFIFLTSSVFLILILFFYDLRFLEVDRRISFPAIIIAIIWAFFRGNLEIYLIGGVVGFLFYFIQYWGTKILLKREGVGIGDFELGALMGLLLGWKLFLPAIFCAYILGTIIALPILVFQKQLAKKIPRISGHLALPMGAFLMPSLLLFLYNGQALLDWYWQILI
jgi:leader peptidase (prepilin peptidase)/N-methyltransferase